MQMQPHVLRLHSVGLLHVPVNVGNWPRGIPRHMPASVRKSCVGPSASQASHTWAWAGLYAWSMNGLGIYRSLLLELTVSLSFFPLCEQQYAIEITS